MNLSVPRGGPHHVKQINLIRFLRILFYAELFRNHVAD